MSCFATAFHIDRRYMGILCLRYGLAKVSSASSQVCEDITHSGLSLVLLDVEDEPLRLGLFAYETCFYH